jgi:alanyl-tRNA synthetase
MTTKKYYLTNPYLTELDAKITHRFKKNNRYYIELDRTIFYPHMSGGQPCEDGSINGISLIETLEDGDKLYHVLPENITETNVHLSLNWKQRFDHMQQHTGQHILSYSINKLYNLDTVGFKIGANTTTIDLDTDSLNVEQTNKVESLCQDIISSNLSISCKNFSKKKLSHLNLDSSYDNYDFIRVVEIDSLEQNPCAGTHVSTTGEVGMIKIIRSEKVNRKLRLHFVCGHRALSIFQKQSLVLNDLFAITSSNFDNLEKNINHMISKTEDLNDQIKFFEEKEIAYQRYFLKRKRQDFGGIFLISQTYENYDFKLLKEIATTLSQEGLYIIVLGNKTETQCQIAISQNKKISGIDVSSAISNIKSLIDGNGGGNTHFAQASGSNIQYLDKAITSICQDLAKKLSANLG